MTLVPRWKHTLHMLVPPYRLVRVSDQCAARSMMIVTLVRQ